MLITFKTDVIKNELSRRKFLQSGAMAPGGLLTAGSKQLDAYPAAYNLKNFTTQPGARTITLDITSHYGYLSVGEYMPGTGRRPVKPNTFRVIDIKQIN